MGAISLDMLKDLTSHAVLCSRVAVIGHTISLVWNLSLREQRTADFKLSVLVSVDPFFRSSTAKTCSTVKLDWAAKAPGFNVMYMLTNGSVHLKSSHYLP